jgi:hypothetical protein
VLADRGYGYWPVGNFIEDWLGGGSFGYPTTVVLDPDMIPVHAEVGYAGWFPIQQAILDNL